MQEMQKTQVRSLGREDPLKEEMATHSSILPWEIPWTEDSGGLLSMGLHWVGHNWSYLAYMHVLEEERATHSIILVWRVPGTEGLGGLLSMRSHRVEHDWSDSAAQAAAEHTCKHITFGTLFVKPTPILLFKRNLEHTAFIWPARYIMLTYSLALNSLICYHFITFIFHHIHIHI